MDKRIEKFIKKHHVLTLATALINADGVAEAYCANMFYAFCAEQCCFVFTTSVDTRHGAEAFQNCRVAGSVVLETRVVGKVQGLQFQGCMTQTEDEALKKVYLKKYPYAALADLNLWALEVDFLKLTDNTLGFGKKLIWRKDE